MVHCSFPLCFRRDRIAHRVPNEVASEMLRVWCISADQQCGQGGSWNVHRNVANWLVTVATVIDCCQFGCAVDEDAVFFGRSCGHLWQHQRFVVEDEFCCFAASALEFVSEHPTFDVLGSPLEMCAASETPSDLINIGDKRFWKG